MDDTLIHPATPAARDRVALSAVDRAVDGTVPLLFLYRRSIDTGRLKESMAQALALYPDFASRVIKRGSRYTLQLSGGAVALRVQTGPPIEHILADLDAHSAHLVHSADPDVARLTDRSFTRIWITQASGGGTAIGLSYRHCVGDAKTALMFMSCWAALARGESPPAPTRAWDRQARMLAVLGETRGRSLARRMRSDEIAMGARLLARRGRHLHPLTVFFGAREISALRAELEHELERPVSTNTALTANLLIFSRDVYRPRTTVPCSMFVDYRHRLGFEPNEVGNLIGWVSADLGETTTVASMASELEGQVASFDASNAGVAPTQRFYDDIEHSPAATRTMLATYDVTRTVFSISNIAPFEDSLDFGAGHLALTSLPRFVSPLNGAMTLTRGLDGQGMACSVLLPRAVTSRVEPALRFLHRLREPGDHPPVAYQR
jgi:hypothetical protein